MTVDGRPAHPVAIEYLRHRKEAKRDAAEAVAQAATGSVE